MNNILKIAKNAKAASKKLAQISHGKKKEILLQMAGALIGGKNEIIKANFKDLKDAKGKLGQNMSDRLMLDNKRIETMALCLREIAKLKDYIGEILETKELENGLMLMQKIVPFGVIGVVYESRPNVTSDICGMCLKSSSAVILKGGSESRRTNKVIVDLFKKKCPIENAFQLIESSDRTIIRDMLNMREDIDLIIPRGGKDLINFVRENSKIPIIETGTGNCHIYLDEKFDLKKASRIIINAKTNRPSVCNAIEKLLIHKNADKFAVVKILTELKKRSVEIRGCLMTRKLMDCILASEDDWKREYLDMVIGVMIVENTDQAISHINKYGSGHSEAIISKNKKNIDKFLDEIDAACVYANASTRFTDGYEFGMGAEIGISTQKLHARGPLGLKALTTTKYMLIGNGQIRE